MPKKIAMHYYHCKKTPHNQSNDFFNELAYSTVAYNRLACNRLTGNILACCLSLTTMVARRG